MTKIVEQQKAREMRMQGIRLEDIAKELHVSKSSVSQWTQGLEFPENIKEIFEERKRHARRLSNQAKRAKTLQHLETARDLAQELVSNIDMTPQLSTILCALLYWCEGRKHPNDSVLTFSNSDPDLISLYLTLLRSSFNLNESKFRVLMHLHKYHSED